MKCIANKQKNSLSLINFVKYRLKINHQVDKNVERWMIASAGKDTEKRTII